MLAECSFHGYVADHVASCVVVEQAIEADALDRGDETACGREGLQAAAGANAYHGERAVFVTFLTCAVVDVGERIEFIGYDVDVVAADAVALAGNALAFVHTRDGMELTAADLALLRVEMGSYGVYAGGVANEYNLVGQLFGLQMEVEAGTVGIDNQLGFRKCSFCIHRTIIVYRLLMTCFDFSVTYFFL